MSDEVVMAGEGGDMGGEVVESGEKEEGMKSGNTVEAPSTDKDGDGQLSVGTGGVVGGTKKGASPYQLVFMEDLSSESSLAGSVSPQNLETSGSFTPATAAAPVTAVESEVNPDSEEHCQDQDENRSIVSSSTLVTESNLSCETVETLKDGTARAEGGEEEKAKQGERAGEEPKDEVDTRVVGNGGVGPSEVMIEGRAESVTPPPKPKEHVLSRLSDSDACDIPPFSPLEYHSSEDETRPGGHTPSFPILTPSPLPPGADSPLEDQPTMSILFSGVFYLGSSTVDAPISETEANRKMNILHEQALASHPMPIILSVPISNDGSVLLKDPKTDQLLTTFPVKMILFCVRGGDEALQDCFCLNVRHKRSGTYHCHVFRCEIQEAVST